VPEVLVVVVVRSAGRRTGDDVEEAVALAAAGVQAAGELSSLIGPVTEPEAPMAP
jgi:hypothetical protein